MKIPKDDHKLTDDDDRVALVATTVDPSEPPTIPNPVIDCCVTSIATVKFIWIFRRVECLLGLALLFFTGLAVTGVIEVYEHKHNHTHYFQHVYADIKSPLELKLGDIDHWCLDGRDDTCPKCDDPTLPMSRDVDEWKKAFMVNVKKSIALVKNDDNPDVIFIGDSLVEVMSGGMIGDDPLPQSHLDSVKSIYDKKFNREKGGYHSLRLGISGDTSPNVFWRIRQYEMGGLAPKVWWISVGRNDLFRTKCSEEVTLMGVLRVIEELINKPMDGTVVINSLLPVLKKNSNFLEGPRPKHKNKMYDSVAEVNRRLKNFAKKHHHVVFFDADEVLTTTSGKIKSVKKDLYADRFHPSVQGYKQLATAQAEFVDTIIKKKVSIEEQGGFEFVQNAKTTAAQIVEAEKEKIGNAGKDTEGDEYLNYDDYYGYESLFEEGDDFLNDFSLYGDDFLLDDDW